MDLTPCSRGGPILSSATPREISRCPWHNHHRAFAGTRAMGDSARVGRRAGPITCHHSPPASARQRRRTTVPRSVRVRFSRIRVHVRRVGVQVWRRWVQVRRIGFQVCGTWVQVCLACFQVRATWVQVRRICFQVRGTWVLVRRFCFQLRGIGGQDRCTWVNEKATWVRVCRIGFQGRGWWVQVRRPWVQGRGNGGPGRGECGQYSSGRGGLGGREQRLRLTVQTGCGAHAHLAWAGDFHDGDPAQAWGA